MSLLLKLKTIVLGRMNPAVTYQEVSILSILSTLLGRRTDHSLLSTLKTILGRMSSPATGEEPVSPHPLSEIRGKVDIHSGELLINKE